MNGKSIFSFYLDFFFISSFLTLEGYGVNKNYSGSQVIKVHLDHAGFAKRVIETEGLDIWSRNKTHIDVNIMSKKLNYIKETLESYKIGFETVIPDLQRLIDNQTLPSSKQDKGMNWQEYHRLKVIHTYLDDLTEKYPNLVSVGVIGYSVEGRHLKYIRISEGGPSIGRVIIDGGIHAREWISPAAVTYIIKELVENRNSLPKELLLVDFYILPVSNPDGYEFSHTDDRLWRKNRSKGRKCHGVDLNRNFDFEWGGRGASVNECNETYRGSAPASEPETRAMQSFIWSLRNNLKAYITFHSYGQYILIPYSYEVNSFPYDFEEMKIVANAAANAIFQASGARYTVGNTAITLYPTSGSSDDWVKALAGVKYSYCIELRDNGEFGFILPPSFIVPSGKDAFNAVKVISKAAVGL